MGGGICKRWLRADPYDVIVTINIQADGLFRKEQKRLRDRQTSCGFGSSCLPTNNKYCLRLFTGPGIMDYGGEGHPPRIRVARKRPSSPVSPRLPCLLASSWISRENNTRTTVLYPQGVQSGKGRIMWGWEKRAWGDTDASHTCLRSWYLENRENFGAPGGRSRQKRP